MTKDLAALEASDADDPIPISKPIRATKSSSIFAGIICLLGGIAFTVLWLFSRSIDSDDAGFAPVTFTLAVLSVYVSTLFFAAGSRRVRKAILNSGLYGPFLKASNFFARFIEAAVGIDASVNLMKTAFSNEFKAGLKATDEKNFNESNISINSANLSNSKHAYQIYGDGNEARFSEEKKLNRDHSERAL